MYMPLQHNLAVMLADGWVFGITSGRESLNFAPSISEYPAGVVVASFGGNIASAETDRTFIPYEPGGSDPSEDEFEEDDPIIIIT